MRDELEPPGRQRVRYALRAAGEKAPHANQLRSGLHTRGYLPHLKHEGAHYFVTFRLDDSLPRHVVLQYERERAERLRALQTARANGWATADSEEAIDRDLRRKVERYLDRGTGDCHLREPQVAAFAVEALWFFHGDRYQLGEWVIMPNHVHTIVQPSGNHLLSDIIKSWKQHVARKANALLNRTGTRFWQPEAYDHWIRNPDEHARIAGYIRRNPVTARLCAREDDWLWSSAAAR